MMKKIQISQSDKEAIFKNNPQKNEFMPNSEFSGVVVNKPWGYEYLMFDSPDISIWMLYIKKGFSTSTHCHPNKKTSLIVLLGEANSSTLNEKFNLKETEGVIYEKGVFHTTEAVSDQGVFVIEVETPTDKADLFRLNDKYHRENKSYTSRTNITKKTYNYHYLSIKNEEFKDYFFGKYKFFIKEYDSSENLKKDFKEKNPKLGIILSGKIEKEKLNLGDIIYKEDLEDITLDSKVKLLFLCERKNLVKLSDFVISYLQQKGINNVFLVSGGNIMHLLESIRTRKMNYLCNHHEQASAMAAESYSKLTGKTGFALVTSGPGGTNAITGVAGAWIDSNPLLVISGQSYDKQTIGDSGLRQLGVQELNIIDIVKPITKYVVMIKDPKKIKYHLDEAIYLANSGRPGPVWIDIPINLQMALIEEDALEEFVPPKLKEKDLSEEICKLLDMLKQSKRPVLLVGNGVRLAHAEKEFLDLAEKLSIPILTTRNANDLVWEEHPLYVGRPGSFGQRAANFTIQNSDLLLSIGSRIALAVTGWAHDDFAREAKKIIVDIDAAELNKPTIQADLLINSDAKNFILQTLSNLNNYLPTDISSWKDKIKIWKEKYPVVLPEYISNQNSVNTYYFTEILSELLSEKDIVVTDMGMSFQCVMQAFKTKKGQRLFTSSGLASMGFGLPGAIGACIGNNKNRVICISGDGGLMMNIQELETVIHNKLPIKLFIFNNHGYSAIRETQNTYFKGFLGSDFSSGVGIPDFIKLAESLGFKNKKISNQENIKENVKEVLDYEGPIICEINVAEDQLVIPKQGAFDRPDGKTVPRPIEDMFPYLDREEFDKEMIIDPVLFDPYRD